MIASERGQALWDGERLDSPHTQSDKALRIRRMFEAIAPTYQLVNRLFSLGRDSAWRRRLVALAGVTNSDRVIDIACGTGDVAREFLRHSSHPDAVVGCDFAHSMLEIAVATDSSGIEWAECDALDLPFASGAFTVAACAFGVRNFQNLETGLREMYRVLAVGGRAVILEFTRPSNRVFRTLYEFYSSRVMPLGATLVSRDKTGAYRYLPRSVVSFPDAGAMCEHLKGVGFSKVIATPMTCGIVTNYLATKE